MLRHLLGQPERPKSGLTFEVAEAINQSVKLLRSARSGKGSAKPESAAGASRKLAILAEGLLSAYDELEESVYFALYFGRMVSSSSIAEMGETELEHYKLHIYFYKDAFIRLFSTLDKTGAFLNEIFSLGTERIKPRFSFYTVLRLMKDRNVEPRLEQTLYDLKVKYKAPMNTLRGQRNVEIHSMNMEYVDDLLHYMEENAPLENLQQNMHYLQEGFMMVCLTLKEVFSFCSRRLHSGQLPYRQLHRSN